MTILSEESPGNVRSWTSTWTELRNAWDWPWGGLESGFLNGTQQNTNETFQSSARLLNLKSIDCHNFKTRITSNGNFESHNQVFTTALFENRECAWGVPFLLSWGVERAEIKSSYPRDLFSRRRASIGLPLAAFLTLYLIFALSLSVHLIVQMYQCTHGTAAQPSTYVGNDAPNFESLLFSPFFSLIAGDDQVKWQQKQNFSL